MATKPKLSYGELKAELDQIMQRLAREDLDIDEALQLYKRGLAIVNQLEAYLKSAKNEVQKIKLKFKLQ